MTTMELNLRKEYLYDLIKGMDEITMTRVIILMLFIVATDHSCNGTINN